MACDDVVWPENVAVNGNNGLEQQHLRRQHLQRQGLVGTRWASAEEVVTSLAAVQAQDYAGAKWSLSMRTAPGTATTDAAIERALDEGRILRTHVLRPTWHFVAPADMRWLLALTAPHVHRANGTMYRRFELDAPLLARTQAVLVEALQGGRSATRDELAGALAAAGIEAVSLRLVYILMAAELDGVICSGPRRGKQFTHMLLAERAPQARQLDRDEALAELTRRYFRGHGPAAERDYAWWSGLTLTEVRRGIEMVRSELAREEIDGTAYWSARCAETGEPEAESVLLLPTYDEFFVGFAGGTKPAGIDPRALLFDSMIVLAGREGNAGRIAGTWRRRLEKGHAVLEVAPVPPLDASDHRLAAAAEQFAAFLEMPVEVRAVDEAELKTTGWRRSRLATLDEKRRTE